VVVTEDSLVKLYREKIVFVSCNLFYFTAQCCNLPSTVSRQSRCRLY